MTTHFYPPKDWSGNNETFTKLTAEIESSYLQNFPKFLKSSAQEETGISFSVNGNSQQSSGSKIKCRRKVWKRNGVSSTQKANLVSCPFTDGISVQRKVRFLHSLRVALDELPGFDSSFIIKSQALH
jgi:hypothetical protein